jgi:RNA polymerase sigma-70 factor, ECF subfamily
MKAMDQFEQLIDENLDGLYSAALRFTRDRGRAEDLVQDTVVRALRFRDRFAEGTSFRAWIFTILTHTFIGGYRRQKREREILEGASAGDVAFQLKSEASQREASHPEHAYLEQLLSDDVLKALDSLPEEFRTVVVLCDLEGLAYKDIAEAVGCPVGTVMSRLHRGRRLLESKLLAVAVERGVVRTRVAADAEGAIVDLNQYRRRRSG